MKTALVNGRNVEMGVRLLMQDELPKVVGEDVSMLDMKALDGIMFYVYPLVRTMAT